MLHISQRFQVPPTSFEWGHKTQCFSDISENNQANPLGKNDTNGIRYETGGCRFIFAFVASWDALEGSISTSIPRVFEEGRFNT